MNSCAAQGLVKRQEAEEADDFWAYKWM